MHPALSIVLFTTTSGTGFALLLLLGLGAPLGLLPASAGFAFVGLAVGVGLAVAGLVSSVFHLGRPERALRAFSQWRSSWLSREGVFAVLTFVPLSVFGIGWVFFGATRGFVGLCGVLAAALAAATIYCTGMIYASLKPIHQWHNGWVVPMLSGARSDGRVPGARLSRPAVGCARRRSRGLDPGRCDRRLVDQGRILALHRYQPRAQHGRERHDPRQPRPRSPVRGAAYRGELPFERDGVSYRAQTCRAAAPDRPARRLCTAGSGEPVRGVLGRGPGAVAAGIGVVSAALGLVVERWLFFAEAKHTVTLYYGAERV